MTPNFSDPAEVREARRLGRAHGILIATVQERRDPKVPGDLVDAYVVYRSRIRMGRRRDPAQLLAFVQDLIAADRKAYQGIPANAAR